MAMRLARPLLAVAVGIVLAVAVASSSGANAFYRQATAGRPDGARATASPTIRAESPLLTPPVPDTHTLVNGCDPAARTVPGPWGLCLVGPPHFACCSAALVVWSGIVAGAVVDLKGAVPIDPRTRRPQSSAVLLLGPDGWLTEIPVARTGAFDGRVTFPVAGSYQLGVLYRGRPADLDAFQVAWRYRVIRGPTLDGLLPNPWTPWPRDDLMLAAEIGRRATWTIVLENGKGVPQPLARLTPTGPVADSRGRVTVTYQAKDGPMPPDEIATGLYVQAYADLRPEGAGLVGFPPGTAALRLPTSAPFSVRRRGVTYYDVEDFFDRADAWFHVGGPGMPPPVGYDGAAGVVSFDDPLSLRQARLELATGTVERAVPGKLGRTLTWSVVGHVHPLLERGQLYLTLPDLMTVAQAVAWAAPDGHGGLLFSDSYLP